MDYAHIVDPWTTCFGLYGSTSMQIFFLKFSQHLHHYVYQWWLAKSIDRVPPVDKEGGLWDCSICRFCHLQWMLEPIPHKYQGWLCYLFSRVVVWIVWLNTCKVPANYQFPISAWYSFVFFFPVDLFTWISINNQIHK